MTQITLDLNEEGATLLRQQYFTLLDVRNQERLLTELNQDAIEHFEGLLNFFEALFEENPTVFPLSEEQ